MLVRFELNTSRQVLHKAVLMDLMPVMNENFFLKVMDKEIACKIWRIEWLMHKDRVFPIITIQPLSEKPVDELLVTELKLTGWSDHKSEEDYVP